MGKAAKRKSGAPAAPAAGGGFVRSRWLALLIAAGVALAGLSQIGQVLGGLTGFYSTYKVVIEFFGPRGSAVETILATPEKASLAVLPFSNLSDDSQQNYFSEGLAEELRTELGRIPGLFVSARNSAAQYKAEGLDTAKLGRELGVRYILSGAVQRAGEQVRVNVRLVLADTGTALWSERYDRPLQDVFAIQDDITQAIASRLIAQIRRQDLAIAKSKRPDKLEAYDLVLKGHELFNRVTAEDTARSKESFEKAIALDPRYAAGYGGLAGTYARGFLFHWGEPQGAAALDKAVEYGNRSFELDPTSSFAVYHVTLAYMFRNELDEAEALVTRALTISPHDAELLDRLYQQGLDVLQRVLRVDPFHRVAIHAFVARGYVMLRDYGKAAEPLRLCLAKAANYRICYEVAALYYAETGDIEKAKEAVVTLQRLDPAFTLATARGQVPFKSKADQDRFISAFQIAGMK